ncbi:hypothetical protein HJC23_009870 [Cyclotella cryptica]|uniref:EF-hand domain-containing protein n=1 Tax=Cyclotella cryptica TaxID=29204 RepID=A0ABD3QCN7_9STRA
MPEVELRRDPLGANRGRTIRQRADSVSDRIKKHLHDKYYIPPYRPTNRNWEITFASLGWKRHIIQKFWRLFCQINVSRDGGIKLNEFLDFFDLDWTPWTERCFSYFDTTGGGDIDFLEFMVSVWNVCTFKINTLSNFAFDMYDQDSDGELSIPEIEKMVEELYGEKGGRKCFRQATQYAEERGGALSLNAFIAFTATHQLLLFPMFAIQRTLQRKIFGIRYWKSVERKSKEGNDNKNQANFNPRHVQILLRTYQTGGAAAVLSHTGDPNKGLRDWYENQKQDDIQENDEEETTDRPILQRWQSIKDSVKNKTTANMQWRSVTKNIRNGKLMKQETLRRMKVFKQRNSGNSKADLADVVHANADGDDDANDQEHFHNRPSPSAPPKDFVDAVESAEPNDTSMMANTIKPSSANVPPDIVEALKNIRAKHANTPAKDAPSLDSTVTDNRPISASAPPADVAEALKNIRAKRANTPSNRVATEFVESEDGRPGTASAPPPDIAEALHSIRAKRNDKSTNDLTPIDTNASSKRKPRPRRRIQRNVIPNNVRQRQAGSMFVTAGQSDGWLK